MSGDTRHIGGPICGKMKASPTEALAHLNRALTAPLNATEQRG